MIEGIAVLTVLAGMGIYFVKSTDLPQELKDRSVQLKSETQFSGIETKKKYSFPTEVKIAAKEIKQTPVVINTVNIEAQLNEAKIKEAKRLEKLAAIELQNKKIDELTLAITSLEQELRINREKTAEIEAQIEWHLRALQLINENKIS